ncbi:hypothetical protein LTR84_009167 [Exophiala bonariae]|uniref:Xylanolytic transcriptional activator regulatory domain-containing protein n=1 Tax=Exophiala bonariae TaxID=1690606 RepID=A0AAV9MVA2_9EURO|nr:hypothetical protein LTR84_009167 [Exophiala bonariae]
MHDVRRGYKLQSLIISREEAVNIENHDLEDVPPREEILMARHMDFEIEGDSNEPEELYLRGEPTKSAPPLLPEQSGPTQPGTNAFQPAIASPSTEFNPRVSRNAMTTPGDPASEIRSLADVVHPQIETSTTDWLLDETFMNIFDDWRVDAPWSEAENLPFPETTYATPSSTGGIAAHATVLDLRQIWYVQVGYNIENLDAYCDKSGRRLPTKSTSEIDESFRTSITKELGLLPSTEPLPSIDFMNLCIQLFFTRFNVAIPLIHAPTFRPSLNHVLLILAMSAAGATTMPGAKAKRIGSSIFERAAKLGLSYPWERALSDNPQFTPWNIKGSTISQSIAILSEDPSHRANAAAYHGCLISIARHFKIFTEVPEIELPDTISDPELDILWRKWAIFEEMKRAALIIHIHDAELAALFHQEPVFRHSMKLLSAPAPDNVFQARTAATWAGKYRLHQQSRLSYQTSDTLDLSPQFQSSHKAITLEERVKHQSTLYSWARLAGIGATVCEYRQTNTLSPMNVAELELSVLSWFSLTGECCLPKRPQEQLDLPFGLRPLWHQTFIALYTDLNTLEHLTGRDGIAPSTRALQYIEAWISSRESQRCLFHSLCIQQLVSSGKLNATVAFHTPRVIFAAALCWQCFIVYSQRFPIKASISGSYDDISEYLMGLPEVEAMRNDSSHPALYQNIVQRAIFELVRILQSPLPEMKASTLCVLEGALRQMTTNGISKRFADILQVFILGDT